MHGHDISPLLKDPHVNWPHPVLLTGTGRRYGSDTNVIPTGEAVMHGPIPWYVMLRQGRHKYVRPLNANDLEELYDLKRDPDELVNLAVKPNHQEKLGQLRAAAIAELRRTGAGFVERMPPVRQASRQ